MTATDAREANFSSGGCGSGCCWRCHARRGNSQQPDAQRDQHSPPRLCHERCQVPHDGRSHESAGAMPRLRRHTATQCAHAPMVDGHGRVGVGGLHRRRLCGDSGRTSPRPSTDDAGQLVSLRRQGPFTWWRRADGRQPALRLRAAGGRRCRLMGACRGSGQAPQREFVILGFSSRSIHWWSVSLLAARIRTCPARRSPATLPSLHLRVSSALQARWHQAQSHFPED